ncbi:hypothetical protein JXL21_02315 [Candidatus Bathyarchaeota archaeon]|nr:hypothetical protein [Candidatus Bathyarchaeota archaeon]
MKIGNNVTVILMVFVAAASFYAGQITRTGDAGNEGAQAQAISDLENQVLEKDAIIDELLGTVSELNDQMTELSGVNDTYRELLGEYAGLSDNYSDVSSDYRELMGFYEAGDSRYRVITCNMSFSIPNNYVIYLSGLYQEEATPESGILTASTTDEDNIISFSWDTVSEPDLDETLATAYESVGKVFEANTSMVVEIDERTVMYSVLKTEVNDRFAYVIVATWYEEHQEKHYVCVIQDTENDVYDQFIDFMGGYVNIS